MKTRTRYTIIFSGILIFFVLAPLIIFYVGGITLDRNANRYVKTGILSIKTSPRSAKIYLNEKLYDTSPVNIRFLDPAEYDVMIQKEGYYDWQKKIQISAGKVSWVAQGVQELHLLKNNSPVITKHDSVSDFAIIGKSVVYLAGDKIIIDNLEPGHKEQYIPLPSGFDKITPSYDNKHSLISGPAGVALIDISELSLADITALTPKGSRVEFAEDNRLYSLIKDTLIRTSWPERQQETINQNVYGYAVNKNQLYYLSKSGNSLKLFVSSLEDPSGSAQQLGGELPMLDSPNILITPRKDIFVYGNGSIYKMNDRPELLSASVTDLTFEPQTMSLAYTTSGQLFGYNFNEGRPELITRFGQGIGTPIIRPEVGYVFFAEGSSIKAWELDTRDHSNNYELEKTSVAAKKIMVDQTSTWLYWLDQGLLQGKQIR